jgi:hypothetical protein
MKEMIMAIDLSENGNGYNELKDHIGHRIVIACYGRAKDPRNISIECETCETVLVDFDKPEKQRKCGVHTKGALSCPKDKKGVCTFHPDARIKCMYAKEG